MRAQPAVHIYVFCLERNFRKLLLFVLLTLPHIILQYGFALETCVRTGLLFKALDVMKEVRAYVICVLVSVYVHGKLVFKALDVMREVRAFMYL
jgi:hypothetical protein